jgi:hypothetical protein
VPAAASAADQAEHEPFVSLRLSFAGSPWRLSGGWLVLAGMLAAQGAGIDRGALLPLLLAVVLAEVLWGALWWQLAPAHAWAHNRARRRPALPYVQPDSPAGRLLGWPEPGPAAAILRTGLPLAGLALLMALPLGPIAVALTGGVLLAVLLAMAARLARLFGLAAWLQTLCQAALPYALGVAVSGPWPAAPHSHYLAGLGLGYILLARALIPPPASTPANRLLHLLLAGAGLAAIVVVLLASGLLLAAGVAGLLGVAPLLLLARLDSGPARAAQPWALAVVALSAAAIGLGIG